jgi:Zn finger protein HypA/HybF involved in hydrogenase expression
MRDVPPVIKPVIIEFIDDDTPIESLPAEGASGVDAAGAETWLAEIHEALFAQERPTTSASPVSAGSFPAAKNVMVSRIGSVDVLSVDLRFRCPHCAQRIQVDVRSSREMFQCPRCEGTLQIPGVTHALKALSENATTAERINCRRMCEEFQQFDPADREGAGAWAHDEPTGNILSIEVRLSCAVCGQASQIDARSHGVAADCPGCQTPLRVPDWRDLLVAVFARGTDTRDPRAFSPLTAEERDFLSAPFTEARKGWLARLSGGAADGGE